VVGPFPTPTANGYNPPVNNQQGVATPLTYLLPFMEQQNLWNQILQFIPVTPNSGGGAMAWDDNFNSYSIPVKSYVCPSDPSVGPDNSCPQNPGGPPYAAATSYACNALVFDGCTVTPGSGPASPVATINHAALLGLEFDGTPLPPFYYPRFADITDGLSTTIFYAEKLAFCADATAVLTNGQCPPPGGFTNCGGNNWSDPLLDFFAPVYNDLPNGVITLAYTPQITPNYQLACDPTRPSSPHPGVILVCLGDGSVHTVSGGINPLTWFLANVPNDGQVLPSDW
jgi:hypothetical protein